MKIVTLLKFATILRVQDLQIETFRSVNDFVPYNYQFQAD